MSSAINLSGMWMGRFEAAPPDIDANSFIAVLIDMAGALTGSITEPDEWAEAGVLRASVSGSWQGSEVQFFKLYDGESYVGHGVDYRGTINDRATRIAGQWSFATYSAAFEMYREVFDEEIRAVERAVEDVEP